MTMPQVKPYKVEAVNSLKKLMEEARGVLLIDFTGLDAHETVELRRRIKKTHGIMKVIKNTLARIALQESRLEMLRDFLVGPNAFIVAYEDPLETLKTITEFQREFEKVEIKAGIIDDVVYSQKDLERIAKLPPLSESRANLVGVLEGNLYQLVWVFDGLLNGLVTVLNQIEDARKEEG